MRSSITLFGALAGIVISSVSFAGPAEDIIAKDKCNKCHTATTTKKAPSWASVATKYKANPDAANKLFNELKKGGKIGDEDDHVKVVASDADLKAIVAIVLNSK